jgi:hypothetical protein
MSETYFTARGEGEEARVRWGRNIRWDLVLTVKSVNGT